MPKRRGKTISTVKSIDHYPRPEKFGDRCRAIIYRASAAVEYYLRSRPCDFRLLRLSNVIESEEAILDGLIEKVSDFPSSIISYGKYLERAINYSLLLIVHIFRRKCDYEDTNLPHRRYSEIINPDKSYE